MQPHFENYEYGADVGVRGFGNSKAEAFAQAAVAMMAAVTDPACIRPLQSLHVRCEAPDDELLLVEWLNTLLYEMATRRLIFSRFEVRIDGERLSAEAWGEPLDRERHHLAVEIKGATLTTLRVARHADGWLAQTVIDV